MINAARYSVKSDNFSWHEAVPAATYTDALETAKRRGFEATIYCGETRVAHWSALYGTRTVNRELAR
jgi:hypothetical protein